MTATAVSGAISLADRRETDLLAENYAQWALRCYTILDKTLNLVPLRLNPIQRAIGQDEARQFAEHGEARQYILKARQGGVSTDQQARALHLIWHHRGATAITLADNRDNTDKIFGVTKRAIEHFPAALLPRLGDPQTREIGFPGRDSRFWTGTAGAKTMGRGPTISRLHASEFAYWDDPTGTLSVITPALVPSGSAIVIETTGGGYDSAAHQFWKRAVARETSYRPLFFPWWECDPLHYRMSLLEPDELGKLEPAEQDLVARHGLTLEQLKWRRAKLADLGESDFLREYAEDADSCWLASGGTYYDATTLKALRLRAPEPIETQLNGALEVYGTREHGERVIMGSDTAEGVGGDRASWVARTLLGNQLLAQFADSHADPNELADSLAEWGLKRFAGAFLVVEKNMHGITVLRRLRDHHNYPMNLLYVRETQDKAKASAGDRLGWMTTGQTVPLMLDAGRQLLQGALDGTVGCPSAECLSDASAVRRDDTGRVKLTGRDVLVAEMLCWLGRAQAVRRMAQPVGAVFSIEQPSPFEVV